MHDRTANSVGIALTAVILIVASVGWPHRWVDPIVPDLDPVVASIVVIVFIGLLASRYSIISNRPAGLIAIVGGICLFAYSLVTVVLPTGDGTTVLHPIPIMTVGLSALVVGFGSAEMIGLERTHIISRVKSTSVATVLGAGALMVGTLTPVLMLIVLLLVVGEISTEVLFIIGIVFFGVGLIGVSIWFLVVSGRGIAYLDLRWPSIRDIGYGIGGVIILVVVAMGVGFIFSMLNVPTADNTIEETARTEGAQLLLLAIPFAWLAIGLGEELVFRGVIQRYLMETFSVPGAIIITSIIFSLVHIPAYFTPDPLALVSVLSLIFGLSLILGWTYVRTENLLVPIFIHGTYNAIVFLALYASLTA